jgi:hypothetical protein
MTWLRKLFCKVSGYAFIILGTTGLILSFLAEIAVPVPFSGLGISVGLGLIFSFVIFLIELVARRKIASCLFKGGFAFLIFIFPAIPFSLLYGIYIVTYKAPPPEPLVSKDGILDQFDYECRTRRFSQPTDAPHRRLASTDDL